MNDGTAAFCFSGERFDERGDDIVLGHRGDGRSGGLVTNHRLEEAVDGTVRRDIRRLRAACPARGPLGLHVIDEALVYTGGVDRVDCLLDAPPTVTSAELLPWGALPLVTCAVVVQVNKCREWGR
jgi:hypothetical protein